MPAVTTLIGHPVYYSFNYWTVPLKSRLRVVVLDVDGRAFVIYIDAHRDRFEAFVEEAEQVIQTLQYEG